jgi:diguanylate cyclase (GGDEF)-like protein/PAS domain S-box-containing protein
MQAKQSSFWNRHYFIFLGLFFGLGFSVIESAVHVYVFHIGIIGDMHSIWLRCVTFLLFLCLGITKQSLINSKSKSEQRTKHLNQTLRSIRKVNQCITYEKDKERLIKKSCELLVETRGYLSAWIALYDEQNRFVSFAHAGLGTEANLLKTNLETGNIPSCSQRALEHSGAVQTDISLHLCSGCPLLHHEPGQKALTINLEHDAKEFGVFSVSFNADLYEPEEKTLFTELSRDISFALYNLDLEKSQKEIHNNFWILAEHSPWGISIMSADQCFEYFNLKFIDMLGYTLKDLPDKETWFQKAHPDPVYRDQVISLWQEQGMEEERSKNSVSLIVTVQCKDGTNKIVHLRRIASIQDKLFLSYDDITEQEQTKEALKNSEQKFRRCFEASPDPIFLLDKDGIFIDVNQATLSKFICNKKEVIGTSLENCPFFPQESRRQIMQKFKMRKQGYDVPTYSLEMQDKNDSTLFVEVNVGIFEDQGQFAGEIVVARDISKRKAMEDKLKLLSFYDSLTGLYNRTLFEEEMKRLGYGRHTPIGIIVCDVDGLKLINDSLGHEKGDELLQLAANVLKRCFRESDIVARIGGDEFAVLLPESGQEVTHARAQRIRTTIDEYNAQQPLLHLHLSIGYAVTSHEKPEMQNLFRQADDNMYQEKLKNRPYSRKKIIQALITGMEVRDFFSEGHGERVQHLALLLGQRSGLTEEGMHDLYLLAQFHDLGKVGIPESLLFKPTKLTDQEFQTIKKHCEIGYRIAQTMTDLQPKAEYILKHHEWWNGQGYPLGLRGEDIPLECRIIAIVEAYEIMTSNRPYHRAISSAEAVTELRKWAGIQFDPDLVERFVELLEEDKKHK